MRVPEGELRVGETVVVVAEVIADRAFAGLSAHFQVGRHRRLVIHIGRHIDILFSFVNHLDSNDLLRFLGQQITEETNLIKCPIKMSFSQWVSTHLVSNVLFNPLQCCPVAS